MHGDVGHEVARTVELGHAVDRPLGELGRTIAQAGDVAGLEPLDADVAVDGVVGRVHLHQRADGHVGAALLVTHLRPERGPGALSQRSDPRSISITSACFVTAQNGV